MVQLVTGDVVSKCARADLFSICDAATFPRLFGEVLEKEKIGMPHALEFVDQTAERPRIEVGCGNVVILFETGQWGLVISANAERAITEDALGIRDMADYLFDCPFTGRVRDPRLLFG